MPADELEHIRRLLFRWHEGLLTAGELVHPVRIVLDPATGQPVMPVTHAALEEDDVTLHIPDDADDALHMLGRLVELDARTHESFDRWRIHFGAPDHPCFAILEVESVKRVDLVADGDDLREPNPLRAAEPGVCKRLNSDRDSLASLCRLAAGMTPESPAAVSLDPYGISVRARFGVVRVEFDHACATPAEANGALDALLARARGA